jgi:hypothetical protein
MTERLPVSLCISTRNAAHVLAECIESCAPWVEEIVVVDMESEDETLAIARRYGARIIQVPNAGWAEPGRQRFIDAARQPWILVLDADERASPGLMALARDCVARDDVDGVWLPRQNITFGVWSRYSGIWPDRQLRLFRTSKTTWPAIYTHAGAQVEGRTIRAPADLDVAIVHHSYDSMGDWLRAADRYTSHELVRLGDAGRSTSAPLFLAVGGARFLEAYVLRQGFRGGRHGLLLSALAGLYWVITALKALESRVRGSSGVPTTAPGRAARGDATPDA